MKMKATKRAPTRGARPHACQMLYMAALQPSCVTMVKVVRSAS
jgi:hypothetical protein